MDHLDLVWGLGPRAETMAGAGGREVGSMSVEEIEEGKEGTVRFVSVRQPVEKRAVYRRSDLTCSGTRPVIYGFPQRTQWAVVRSPANFLS